jgi:hypothetical protein
VHYWLHDQTRHNGLVQLVDETNKALMVGVNFRVIHAQALISSHSSHHGDDLSIDDITALLE